MPKTTKEKANSKPRATKKSTKSDSVSDSDMPKTSKKATSKAGGKKKKDPNAPKRGLSAYMFFANEMREQVREENPGITFGQVGKVLGDRWKALSEKERKPFEKKAADDKDRYEREKAKYNAEEEEGESE